jgi:ribonuclease P protein component
VLPAAVRMRTSAEFSDTVAHGARSAAGALVVHVRRPDAPTTAPAPSTHVGLVVSRAVGNAVVRHRVSRQLRHLLADRIGAVPPGSRVVVRALPPAAEAGSAALATALDRALARATERNNSAHTRAVSAGKGDG